jgi:hypothetical protein
MDNIFKKEEEMKKEFRSFEDARKFVHALKLNNDKEWKEYCKSGNKPDDIPSYPIDVYKNKGWKGLGDWLGTGRTANFKKQYRSFEEARKFAQSLNLKSNNEWQNFVQQNKSINLPIRPDASFKNKGWTNWGDFLGTGTIANAKKQYRSFEEAREFVHALKLNGQKEWERYYKSGNKPDDIPTHPDATYKNKGYKGYGDWLGTGRIANAKKQYRSFEEAREFVHALKLKSHLFWREYAQSGKKPDDIPADPHHVYKNKGWTTWGNWLGTGKVADQLKQYRSFEDAKKFVHTLNLKNGREWKEYCKSGGKPDDIPAGPRNTYKDKGWAGIVDWLGNETEKRIRLTSQNYLGFDDAQKFVRKLKLTTSLEFKQQIKSHMIPENIPKSPQTFYLKKGWTGWGDFLGTITNFNKKFISFDDARKFVHTLNLKSAREWEIYCKSDNTLSNIPTRPSVTYKNKGWVNWGDWLGTFEIASYNKEYLSFKEAKKEIRKIAKKYNIKNNNDWTDAVKKGLIPDNIPATPWWVYRKKKKRKSTLRD